MGRLHALNPYFDHAKKSYGLLTVFEKLRFCTQGTQHDGQI